MRLGPLALAVAALGAGCSLIVQFDPEGQPCGPNNTCLSGYGCVSGACKKGADGGVGDGGVSCTGVVCDSPGPCQLDGGSCNAATGRCVYPARPSTDLCTDNDLCTQSDHCDGDGGCTSDTRTACATPPGACYADAGTCSPTSGACTYLALNQGDRCEDGNPCTVGETCGAGGVCSGGSARVCNTPSSCGQSPGSCDTIKGCVYPARPGGTCDDGNLCTVGDACDAGNCVPGPVCPPPLPCQIGLCQGDGGCTYSAAPDGTSCGVNASARCCGGACADISTSALHCGGCGTACISGYTCESVAVTNTCLLFPVNTTGRCTCNSTLTGTCPRTQTCRAVAPGNNRCAPADAGDCSPNEKLQPLPGCPQYCLY